MPCATIVVERPHDCPWPLDGHRVITMDRYTRDPHAAPPGSRIVNLCRNGYLSRGYYCSLLGEARGHAVLPSVATGHVRQGGGNCEVVRSAVGQAAFAGGRMVRAGSSASATPAMVSSVRYRC